MATYLSDYVRERIHSLYQEKSESFQELQASNQLSNEQLLEKKMIFSLASGAIEELKKLQKFMQNNEVF